MAFTTLSAVATRDRDPAVALTGLWTAAPRPERSLVVIWRSTGQPPSGPGVTRSCLVPSSPVGGRWLGPAPASTSSSDRRRRAAWPVGTALPWCGRRRPPRPRFRRPHRGLLAGPVRP